jgi:hypothetical protein
MKLVMLLDLGTGRLYTQEIFMIIFFLRGKINNKMFNIYTKVKLSTSSKFVL